MSVAGMYRVKYRRESLFLAAKKSHERVITVYLLIVYVIKLHYLSYYWDAGCFQKCAFHLRA